MTEASAFVTIPRDRLLKLIEVHISDSRLPKLIQMFLDQSIMESRDPAARKRMEFTLTRTSFRIE